VIHTPEGVAANVAISLYGSRDCMKRKLSAAVVLLAFGIGVTSNSLWNLLRHWDTRRPPTGIAQKVGPYWIYENQVIEAEPSPNAGEDPIKVREDSVFIVFYPTGEFASIGCALYTADGVENARIMAEDDFIVHKGIWKRNSDGTITTTWRLSHRPAINNHSLADERSVIFKPIGNVVSQRGLLEGGGSSYVQIVGPEIKNLEALPRMIAADNR
jgi:hypothetical protein